MSEIPDLDLTVPASAAGVQATPATSAPLLIPATSSAPNAAATDPAQTRPAQTRPPGPPLQISNQGAQGGQGGGPPMYTAGNGLHPTPPGVTPATTQPRWGTPVAGQQCPQQNAPARQPLGPPQLSEVMTLIMGSPNEFLSHWLGRWGLEWRRVIDHYDVDVSRNRAVREFLAADVPRGKRYMLMIDADMAPDARADNILRTPGDLLFCGHAGSQGGVGHCGPGNFASACFRVSVRALQEIGRISETVWFAMGKDDTRSQRTHCECAYFNVAARRAGFQCQQVGIIGHVQTTILFPVNNRPDQWQLIWPAQFRQTIPGGMPVLGSG